MTEVLKRFELRCESHIMDIGFSHDQNMLAAVGVEGEVYLCKELNHLPQLKQIGEHMMGANQLDWHPNSHRLLTAGQDGKVKVWDAIEEKELINLKSGSSWTDCCQWNDDGTLFASAAGKFLKIWDQEGNLCYENNEHPSTISDIAWKPNEQTLAVCCYGGVLFHQVGKEAQRFEWQGSSLVLAWSPNGKFLATGDQDSTVHFWYTETGKDSKMWGYPTKVKELSWDISSRYLATGGGESVIIWDCSDQGPEDTEPLVLEKHEKFISCLSFEPQGIRLLSASRDGSLCLWDPSLQSDPLQCIQLNSIASQVVWSKDGSHFAIGEENGNIAIYDIK